MKVGSLKTFERNRIEEKLSIHMAFNGKSLSNRLRIVNAFIQKKYPLLLRREITDALSYIVLAVSSRPRLSLANGFFRGKNRKISLL
jgi:hypothetical protein